MIPKASMGAKLPEDDKKIDKGQDMNKKIFKIIMLFFLYVQSPSVIAQNVWNAEEYNGIPLTDKKIHFFDDFIDNRNNWTIGEDKGSARKITGAYYYFESKDEGNWRDIISVSVDEKKDFEIELKTRFIKGTDDGYGLEWGRKSFKDWQLFDFLVNGSGQYTIAKYDQTWFDYVAWQTSNIVGKTDNKFTVRKVNNIYYFFLNEQFVHSTDYEPFYGDFIGFKSANKSTIHIDYLRISYLKKTLTVTQAIKKDITPPTIHLQRGIKRISSARKNISGQATDESGVAIVEINGKEAQLDERGNFSTTILLKPGKNRVVITAIDIYENKATKTFEVERSSKSVATPVAESIKTGRYFALLIAVEDYQSSTVNDLNQPIKDAYQIKNILQDYSFDSENIILLENPGRDKIIDKFDQLSQKITKHDNLLIFYAGHGYWDERFKQGYWLPSNASKESRSKWLSNSTVRDYIRGIQAKHTLLVSDACFSGGIFKTRTAFDDAPPATNELYKLPSRKAMTSGTLTEVPDKSVFIEYFVKRLRENENKYLSSEQLFIKFKNAVINNSPVKQVPQYGEIREAGDEGGDFIFVRREN